MSEMLKFNLYNLNKLPEERYLITPNSNNPPSVLAGTIIYFGKSITTNAIISKDTDQNFSWGVGNFPAISDGIWYLWVDVSGAFGATISTSITVSKNYILGGWYDSTNTKKILARFVVASSAIVAGTICIMINNLVAELYTTTTSAPSISGLNIIKDGGIWKIYAQININSSGSIKQFVNNDTTDANYYSANQPSYTSGNFTDTATIYDPRGNANNGRIQLIEEVQFTYNKYMAVIHASNNKISSTTTFGTLNYNISGDDEATTRTNITQLSWALSAGSWVAGSDIRIYTR